MIVQLYIDDVPTSDDRTATHAALPLELRLKLDVFRRTSPAHTRGRTVALAISILAARDISISSKDLSVFTFYACPPQSNPSSIPQETSINSVGLVGCTTSV